MTDGSTKTESVSAKRGTLEKFMKRVEKALSNGSSNSSATVVGTRDEERDSKDSLLGASSRDNVSSDIPQRVQSACGAYVAPTGASCKIDSAVEGAAKTAVAAGKDQLDPGYRNTDIQANSRMNGNILSTTLNYKGNVDDRDMKKAVNSWTGNGETIQISPVRQPEESNALAITMRDTTWFAGRMGFCDCNKAFYVSGLADLNSRTIYLNQDRIRSVIVHALKHELGHYFFGRGHPKMLGDFGYGGIMQYGGTNVSEEDRKRFRKYYEQSSGAGQ
jgi:hypothetical protein